MTSHCKKHGTELFFSGISGIGYCSECEKEKEEKYALLKKNAEDKKPGAMEAFRNFIDTELPCP